MTDNLISRLSKEELVKWRKLLRQEIAYSMNTQRGNVVTLRKIQSELDKRRKR